MVTLSIVICGCLTVPHHATADTFTWWATVCPSASNSTYEWYYGHYHSTPVEATEVEVDLDSDYWDLYATVASSCHVFETNDFTNNDTWLDHGESEYYTPVGYMPPTDATIISVNVMVRFTTYRPMLQLSFSTNNGSSWTTSGTYAESANPYLGIIQWNVTNLVSWTPALLNSTDLCARLTTYPTELTHYYLDYLGYWILWGGDYAGGGDGGQDDDSEEGSGTLDTEAYFSVDNILGIMGLVGLVGAIAAAPLGVYLYKHSREEGVVIVIKMLVLFMFCVTLFMCSLGVD